MKKNILLISLLLSCIYLSAQEINYLPVKFHLVGDDDGSKRVTYERVFDQLCLLNKQFDGTCIQFYIHEGFNEINSTLINENQGIPSINLMAGEVDEDALNIFIVNDVLPPGGSNLGVNLGFYDFANNWVVVWKFEVGESNVMAKQLGYQFDLLPCYFGWGSEGYNQGTTPNPAPAIAPNGFTPTELMDGSNCDVAGDMICDTPPDYNFLFEEENCELPFEVLDPSGTAIEPNANLVMGSFFDCDPEDYYFSVQQSLRMLEKIANDFSYLSDEGPDITAIVSGVPFPTTPTQGNVIETADGITFQWTPVEGATQYMLEIDIFPTFSTDEFQRIFVTETEVNIPLDGSTYFWRVRALNEYSPCAEISDITSFTITGPEAPGIEIPQLLEWEVFPNPCLRGQDISISFDWIEAQEGDIRVFNGLGQEVYKIDYTGEPLFKIPVHQLQVGMYYVILETSQGKARQKFQINE